MSKDKKPEEITDGYHTMAELYDHRLHLTALAFMHMPRFRTWKSKNDHEGKPMGDWFLVGAKLYAGDISYHYEMKDWYLFADVREIDKAPMWDGYTSHDVLNRMHSHIIAITDNPRLWL